MTSKSHSKQINIDIPSTVCSPNKSKNLKQCLSFANLRMTERMRKNQQTTPVRGRPTHQNTLRPLIQNTINKENTLRLNNQYTPNGSHNMNLSNSGSNLVDNTELENKSLHSQITHLTQQSRIIEHNYKLLKQQNQLLNRELIKKEADRCKRREKYLHYKQKSMQYDEIVQKLDELEKLQDQVIVKNQNLQFKNQKLAEALQQILKVSSPDLSYSNELAEYLFAGSEEETPRMEKIKKLAESALNN